MDEVKEDLERANHEADFAIKLKNKVLGELSTMEREFEALGRGKQKLEQNFNEIKENNIISKVQMKVRLKQNKKN